MTISACCDWLRSERPAVRLEFCAQLVHMLSPYELRYMAAMVEARAKCDAAQLQPLVERVNSAATWLSVRVDLSDDRSRADCTIAMSLLNSDNSHVAHVIVDSLLLCPSLWSSLLAAYDLPRCEQFELLLAMAAHHPAVELQRKAVVFEYLRQLCRALVQLRNSFAASENLKMAADAAAADIEASEVMGRQVDVNDRTVMCPNQDADQNASNCYRYGEVEPRHADQFRDDSYDLVAGPSHLAPIRRHRSASARLCDAYSQMAHEGDVATVPFSRSHQPMVFDPRGPASPVARLSRSECVNRRRILTGGRDIDVVEGGDGLNLSGANVLGDGVSTSIAESAQAMAAQQKLRLPEPFVYAVEMIMEEPSSDCNASKCGGGFHIETHWSDGRVTHAEQKWADFLKLHNTLIDMMPEESGAHGNVRSIPYFGNRNKAPPHDVGRFKQCHNYISGLLAAGRRQVLGSVPLCEFLGRTDLTPPQNSNDVENVLLQGGGAQEASAAAAKSPGASSNASSCCVSSAAGEPPPSLIMTASIVSSTAKGANRHADKGLEPVESRNDTPVKEGKVDSVARRGGSSGKKLRGVERKAKGKSRRGVGRQANSGGNDAPQQLDVSCDTADGAAELLTTAAVDVDVSVQPGTSAAQIDVTPSCEVQQNPVASVSTANTGAEPASSATAAAAASCSGERQLQQRAQPPVCRRSRSSGAALAHAANGPVVDLDESLSSACVQRSWSGTNMHQQHHYGGLPAFMPDARLPPSQSSRRMVGPAAGCMMPRGPFYQTRPRSPMHAPVHMRMHPPIAGLRQPHGAAFSPLYVDTVDGRCRPADALPLPPGFTCPMAPPQGHFYSAQPGPSGAAQGPNSNSNGGLPPPHNGGNMHRRGSVGQQGFVPGHGNYAASGYGRYKRHHPLPLEINGLIQDDQFLRTQIRLLRTVLDPYYGHLHRLLALSQEEMVVIFARFEPSGYGKAVAQALYNLLTPLREQFTEKRQPDTQYMRDFHQQPVFTTAPVSNQTNFEPGGSAAMSRASPATMGSRVSSRGGGGMAAPPPRTAAGYTPTLPPAGSSQASLGGTDETGFTPQLWSRTPGDIAAAVVAAAAAGNTQQQQQQQVQFELGQNGPLAGGVRADSSGGSQPGTPVGSGLDATLAAANMHQHRLALAAQLAASQLAAHNKPSTPQHYPNGAALRDPAILHYVQQQQMSVSAQPRFAYGGGGGGNNASSNASSASSHQPHNLTAQFAAPHLMSQSQYIPSPHQQQQQQQQQQHMAAITAAAQFGVAPHLQQQQQQQQQHRPVMTHGSVGGMYHAAAPYVTGPPPNMSAAGFLPQQHRLQAPMSQSVHGFVWLPGQMGVSLAIPTAAPPPHPQQQQSSCGDCTCYNCGGQHTADQCSLLQLQQHAGQNNVPGGANFKLRLDSSAEDG